MMKITEVVKQLLIVNIIFFVGSYFVPVINQYFALYYFENTMFYPWQPLTHMFMHGGVAHIFFNVFALYSFGSTLEYSWGGKKFLLFYLACGLGAALLHTGVNYFMVHDGVATLVSNGFKESDIYPVLEQKMYDTRWTNYLSITHIEAMVSGFSMPAVGASGAIYGLLVAFACMYPNASLALMFIPVPIKAKYFVPGILALDLILGFKGSAIFGGGTGIAHFAHIGGAIMGFILMRIWTKNQFNKNRWD